MASKEPTLFDILSTVVKVSANLSLMYTTEPSVVGIVSPERISSFILSTLVSVFVTLVLNPSNVCWNSAVLLFTVDIAVSAVDLASQEGS